MPNLSRDDRTLRSRVPTAPGDLGRRAFGYWHRIWKDELGIAIERATIVHRRNRIGPGLQGLPPDYPYTHDTWCNLPCKADTPQPRSFCPPNPAGPFVGGSPAKPQWR